MAQTEEEKKAAAAQASLLEELAATDVKVADDKAAEMKENILKDRGASNYLGLGVHDVFIKSIELVKANSGTLGAQFNVENPEGQGRHTFWLSEKALPYTIQNVSSLVVHNTADDKKAEARNYMSNITSAKELVEVAQKKLVDGIAIFSTRASKTQTYTDKNGEIKPSLETSLTSWRPKEDPQQSVAKTTGGTAVSDEALKDLPF